MTQKRKDIVFYIKLFPLPMHKDAYWKAKSIICNKSINMLEANFEGKQIPRTDCNSREIDENLKLVRTLNISSTPTLIMPDGRVHEGTLPADRLIEMIDGRK